MHRFVRFFAGTAVYPAIFRSIVRAILLVIVLHGATIPAVLAQEHAHMPAPHGPMVPPASGESAFPLPDDNARERFARGRNVMHRKWIAAPAEDTLHDGLGPLYAQDSCNACHPDNGRGRELPDATSHAGPSSDGRRHLAPGSIVRLSVRNGVTDAEPHPIYGSQLDTSAIPGVQPEGRAIIKYRMREVSLRGESSIQLREPLIELEWLRYGDAGRSILVSVRAAPPLRGMGLLDLVPDSTLMSLADPDDADRDGISGRVNLIRSGPDASSPLVGRFGWKGAMPSLAMQIASAFHDDMGLTTLLRIEPTCTVRQIECSRVPPAGTPEVADFMFDNLELYLRYLQPPASSETHATEGHYSGAATFSEIGCAKCHIPELRTAADTADPSLASLQFAPYTDLLLHDMGFGLADGRPEGSASGSEWRTAPLWGLSLALREDPNATFLHDGRARTLVEAILWHGGEAQASRDRFRSLDPHARAGLLRFLGSL